MLIQKMRYNYGGMWFEVNFFNGKERRFSTDHVCPSIDLMQGEPTRMQWLEAENNIEKFVLEHYLELFPECS